MARCRTWLWTGIAIAVIGVAVSAALLRERSRQYHGPADEIRIGIPSAYYSLLFLVAEENGYFERNGLKITPDTYEKDYTSVEKLTLGKVDFAVASEYAFAWASLQEGTENLRIVASTATVMAQELVARRDRGIQSPADLNGKRIGVLKDSPADFSLDRFLTLQNLPPEKVTKVSLSYEDCATAIAKGDIDATVLFGIPLFNAEKALAANAVTWPTNVAQPHYWLLIAKEETIEAKAAATRRLLKALLEAQEFTAAHLDDAKSLLARRWDFDPDFIRQARDTAKFDVSLEQAMIAAMEDETDWLAERYPAGKRAPVNFFRLIHLDALDAVRPEAISIFR